MESDTKPLWTVISIQDTQLRNESNQIVPGKRVNVMFVNGDHSMVEVPVAPGWSQTAQDEIEKLAVEHMQVLGMQGPPTQVPSRGTRVIGTTIPR